MSRGQKKPTPFAAAPKPRKDPIIAATALAKAELLYRFKTHYYSKKSPTTHYNYHTVHREEYLQSDGNKIVNNLEICRENAGPDNYLLGRVHYFKGENNEAKALLDPLVSKLPKDRSQVLNRDEQIQYARRWNSLGEMYRRINDNNAFHYFSNAIAMFPILAWPHYNLGIWKRDHNDLFGAIEHLDQAEVLCRTKQINRDPVVSGADLLQWQAERKGVVERLAKESNMTASQIEHQLLEKTQAIADEKAAKAAAEAKAAEIAAKKADEEASRAKTLAAAKAAAVIKAALAAQASAALKNRLDKELYNQTQTPEEKMQAAGLNPQRSMQANISHGGSGSVSAIARNKVHESHSRPTYAAAAAIAVQDSEYEQKQAMIAEAQKAERERLRKAHWYTRLHSKKVDASVNGNANADIDGDEDAIITDAKKTYTGKRTLKNKEKKAADALQPAIKKTRREPKATAIAAVESADAASATVAPAKPKKPSAVNKTSEAKANPNAAPVPLGNKEKPRTKPSRSPSHLFPARTEHAGASGSGSGSSATVTGKSKVAAADGAAASSRKPAPPTLFASAAKSCAVAMPVRAVSTSTEKEKNKATDTPPQFMQKEIDALFDSLSQSGPR